MEITNSCTDLAVRRSGDGHQISLVLQSYWIYIDNPHPPFPFDNSVYPCFAFWVLHTYLVLIFNCFSSLPFWLISSSSGFDLPLFLFPVGVHLIATLGMKVGCILRRGWFSYTALYLWWYLGRRCAVFCKDVGSKSVNLVWDGFRHFRRFSAINEDPKYLSLEDPDFGVCAGLYWSPNVSQCSISSFGFRNLSTSAIDSPMWWSWFLSRQILWSLQYLYHFVGWVLRILCLSSLSWFCLIYLKANLFSILFASQLVYPLIVCKIGIFQFFLI